MHHSSARDRGRRGLALAALSLASCGSRDDARRFSLRGEEIALRGAPRRVVAANAGCAEYALELLEPERIAALPEEIFEFAAAPPDPSAWPASKRIPRYESEAVLKHHPDLVLATPWQPSEVTTVLRRAGVPVLLVPEVRELDDAREVIEFLGRVFEREARAKEIWDGVLTRAETLRKSAPAKPPRVLPYANLGDGGWTAGQGTTLDLALRLAGFENAATAAGYRGHERVDLEAVARFDPEWIVISTEERDGSESASFAALRAAPLTARLAAVRDARVLRLPSRFSGSTTHHVVDAAEWLREAFRKAQ